MKASRSTKNFSFFPLLVIFLPAILLMITPARGQARPQAALPLDETTPAASPTEFESPPSAVPSPTVSLTPSPTQLESPPSAIPSPTVSLTPSPTQFELPPSATPSPTVSLTPSPTQFELPPSATPSGEQTLLLVGLAPTTGLEEFQAGIAYPVLEIGLSALGIYAVQVPQSQADEILANLAALPEVRYAEPNYTVSAQDTFPNDPGFTYQYALTNIRAPQGWDITTGSNTVTIAIVDSGVDLTHPELAPKILAGYDFVNSDSVPQDDNGHGTHVAGIAAAAGNNSLGIAGVSWGARILPVKVLNALNSGTYANVAAGIVWAADQGAQIINLSLGGSSPSVTLENAVNYAASQGVALVAAAGNTGGAILYPARYAPVIAVANTNSLNQRVTSSAFGPEIDLAAPGAAIYSLAIGGGYTTLGGTSMSAPHVSGALALLLSLPGVSTAQARAYLEASALDVESLGWDVFTGYGLIQLDAALLLAIPTPTPTFTATVTPGSQPPAATGQPPVFAPVFPPALNPTFTPVHDIAATALPSFSPTVSATPALTVFFLTPTPTGTPTLASIPPAAKSPAASGRAFWQPCLGAVLILLGLLLAILARRKWQKSTT